MRVYLAALVCALALAGPARANDTSATIKMGGLKFTRSSAIELVSEDLYLSMSEVRVHYVFHNKSAKDVTTLVAFPLPRIESNYFEEPVAIPEPGNANFVRFKTRVDGRDVPLTIMQRATLNGRDITAELRGLGLPLSVLDPKFDAAIKKAPAAKVADLVKRHYMEKMSVDPDPVLYRPLWSLDTSYTRTQTFPAGKDVIVDHSYAPIVGGSVMTALLIDSMSASKERRDMVRDYCVDAAFEKAAKAARDRTGGAEHVQERRLGYVLKTGANWAGPIGKFHLTIDKGATDNMISACLADIKKTGATRFEVERTKFTPTRDIDILILTPIKPE